MYTSYWFFDFLILIISCKFLFTLLICHQKSKCVVLTIKDNVNIVNELRKGETGTKLVEEFRVGTSTISDTKKFQTSTIAESILKFVSVFDSEYGSLSRKVMKIKFEVKIKSLIVLSTHGFCKNIHGQSISGTIFYIQNLNAQQKLQGGSEFRASHSWLRNF